MLVSIHHQIRDPQKWTEAARRLMADAEQGRLPQGLKGLAYLPGKDGRQADCLWEADSVEHLKSFVDGQMGKAAKNDYFEVNASEAMGVPYHDEPLTAVAARTEEAMHLAM